MHIILELLISAFFAVVIVAQIVKTFEKDKPRFKIGDFISTPGGVNQSYTWFKVIRLDTDKKEYLLETYDRFRFMMSFEQSKDQCLIIDFDGEAQKVIFWQ
jgi:hypothetical protein